MLLRKWQGKPLIEQKKRCLKKLNGKSQFLKISIPYDGVEFTEKVCVSLSWKSKEMQNIKIS